MPEFYNDKVNVAILVAPAASMYNHPSQARHFMAR